MPSVLWRCWLGGRKGIRPVKDWVVGWGAGVVVCLERGADLHMSQLMPLPLTVFCICKIQIVFTFLVPAHPDSPESRTKTVKWVCVYMFIQILFLGLCLNVWTTVNHIIKTNPLFKCSCKFSNSIKKLFHVWRIWYLKGLNSEDELLHYEPCTQQK